VANDSLAQAQPAAAAQYSVRIVPTNSLAIASAIAGGLSWFLCPFIGSVSAVVMGYMAKNEIRRTREGGWGWATLGQVLGFANLAVALLILVIIFSLCGGLAMLGTMGAAGSH
jgi:membrane-associated protease RseP (regulator of RpoE activity)